MAREYPETIQEFFELFPTDEACQRYLVQVRWDGKFICPFCSCTESWNVRRTKNRCMHCRRDSSVTSNTLFEQTHIPLRLWFLALWNVVSQKQGVSALGLSRTLGMKREKTVWDLLRKIRRAMVRPGRERLSGIVEVDEVLVGGKRRVFEGRSPQGKTLVLIAAEDRGARGIGRIRMQVIPNASTYSLHKAISEMVEPGSTVRTDGWNPYRGMERLGYEHVEVKRKPSIPGDDPTPLIHRIASLLKRWLLGTHQGGIKKTYLDSYLNEFVFRFNRRTSHSRGKLFYRLVQNMLEITR